MRSEVKKVLGMLWQNLRSAALFIAYSSDYILRDGESYTTRNVYWSRPSVCLCVCPRPPAHATARTQKQLGEVQGVLPSCALLGGFAIGARVSLLCQHSAEREVSASASTRCLYAWFI